MVEAHRRGPDSRLTLLIAGTAVLGVALVLAREATYGVWLPGRDSLQYIAAARNLLAGRGLTGYEGAAFTTWPPGYPLLLAAASLGVFEPVKVAGPLNAALFGYSRPRGSSGADSGSASRARTRFMSSHTSRFRSGLRRR